MQISASLSRQHQELLQRTGRNLQKVSQQLTRKLALDVVGEILDVHRVLTGRSRMGWVAIMRAHGVPVYGTPLYGVRRSDGRLMKAQDVAAAQQEGERAGRARESLLGGAFVVTIENPVDYVVHLDRRHPFILPSIRKVLPQWRAEVASAMRELGRTG